LSTPLAIAKNIERRAEKDKGKGIPLTTAAKFLVFFSVCVMRKGKRCSLYSTDRRNLNKGKDKLKLRIC
jgi:hypothetical protein